MTIRFDDEDLITVLAEIAEARALLDEHGPDEIKVKVASALIGADTIIARYLTDQIMKGSLEAVLQGDLEPVDFAETLKIAVAQDRYP